MRVAMFTNTYLPLLGGVERSVASTAAALERSGHACLVVTPSDPRATAGETHTVRVPSLPAIGLRGFSYRLPGSPALRRRLEGFVPDLVHTHHPFMLGDTGVRFARGQGLPVVFTCHTRWERFVPAGWPLLRRLARRLPVVFANVCDLVIAPTPSIARLLRRRGVATTIAVVPTGIDVARFAAGDRRRGRQRWGLATGEPVIGHVGRLVPEKNLGYLTDAVLHFLRARRGRFLLVGEGRSEGEVARQLTGAGLGERLVRCGRLDGDELADAYAAMDVFAFTACTDTQGLVLAEAAATGCPIVALDAPGPRDLVDRHNGILVPAGAPAEAFAAALAAALEPARHAEMSQAAGRTARHYDLDRCTERLVAVYAGVLGGRQGAAASPRPRLHRARGRLLAEWDLLGQKAALARLMLR